MPDIGECNKCGGVISYRFPIHVCKSVKVFDGDNQKRVKRITIEERDAEMERLRQIYDDVNIDIDGDIVFHREL